MSRSCCLLLAPRGKALRLNIHGFGDAALSVRRLEQMETHKSQGALVMVSIPLRQCWYHVGKHTIGPSGWGEESHNMNMAFL